MTNDSKSKWVEENRSATAMAILEDARDYGRPVILLTGAGISIDSGFPLTPQLKEYLVQIREYVVREGFSNVRQYVEEARWPSRHDLRVDLMLKAKTWTLGPIMEAAERNATQAALIAEFRRDAPTLASSIEEIFGQLDERLWPEKRLELERLYGEVSSLAKTLGRRSPKNIAYRSLLFHLCENNQATIDSCIDHFIRDRTPTTTHQFIYFLTRVLRTQVIFTTNFDPLLENAFSGEGLTPRIYEMQGEGSIPSSRLLLSQPLSIVKLHGGAHQMQTGFNLDDPLSLAALGSFTDLYERLRKSFGKPPLTVVIGYSGSDRRVMDIIAAQVREWLPLEEKELLSQAQRVGRPSVLWVSHDPHPPKFLESAVMTHPDKFQRDASNFKRDNQYPCHFVRYRDGRLFLLEALQTLLRHFPIARSNYQAVNFVPHSVAGKDRSSENAEKIAEPWQFALIHTGLGGGSSSTLVEVADRSERADYRTIWIDLTEVAGVPALIDLVSERITKLDGRLQPVRRPPLLLSLLDKDDIHRKLAEASIEHEFFSCVQWLRHALRRGRYLLALDSLDEFPSEHPALEEGETDNDFRKNQRDLLCRLLKELASRPTLIGDSRIAVALSCSDDQDSKPFVELSRHLLDLTNRPSLDASLVEVLRLHTDTPRENGCLEAFARLCKGQIERPNKTTAAVKAKNFTPDLHRSFIWTVTVLVSCCSRRIRSEVFLRRCVGEYIGRLCPKIEDWNGLKGSSTAMKGVFEFFDAGNFDARLNQLWAEPTEDHQHLNNKALPQIEESIIEAIHHLSGHRKIEKISELTIAPNRQWLYRTEGGYHWMHRDIRNDLYKAIKKSEDYRVLVTAHHVIALFCYDELYERSRDARAFLEYLFHRIASIKLALKAGQFKCALAWATRLLISLHREKHALLTRVRLPGFLRQMRELRHVIEKEMPQLIKKRDAENLEKVRNLEIDLLRLLSDFFLASGHPHSALGKCLHRLSLVMDGNDPFHAPQGFRTLKFHHQFEKFITNRFLTAFKTRSGSEKIDLLAAVRDVAYACHDPVLSQNRFPRFRKKGADQTEGDWIQQMSNEKQVIERTHQIELCRRIYEELANIRAKEYDELEQLIPWTEHDEEMDFFGGLVRKILEFRMLYNHSENWIESSMVYLEGEEDALGELKKFGSESRAKQLQANWPLTEAYPDEKIPGENELVGNVPLLRRRRRRQRHECYRLCLKARIEAADHLRFRVKERAQVRARLLGDERHTWGKICRMLANAESILNRSGGPADRQAMAITRLIHAELLIRRAELLRWGFEYNQSEIRSRTKARDKKESKSKHLKRLERARELQQEAEVLQLACEKSLDEAFGTLSTVEQLMNEGRGENRWRFFYLLTLSRFHLLRAYTRRDSARRSSLTDMTWSARHLVSALSNCGIWTDRYDVLLWWWDVWKNVAKTLHPEPEEFEEYRRQMYARLGIRWDTEDSANRYGRSNAGRV